MMKKYLLNIKEITYGTVIIHAENKKAAENKLAIVWLNGDCHWTNSEIKTISVTEESNGKDKK